MAFILEGIKVVQTASAFAGPMAGRLLADWGADVIWVENSNRAEISRNQHDMRNVGRMIMSDIDYRGENLHRSKRGIALDLSQEEGQKILHKMLEHADVYLSNFRPREFKKFKLEYETLSQLNPRLISANVYGYGKKGPDKDLPATEFTGYFAKSGILHTLQMPGSSPVLNPIGLGDHVAGMSLACGIMSALFMRGRTGRGQEVDVSLLHTGIFTLSFDIAGALVTGQDRQPVELRDFHNPLHNSYQTKDSRWLRLAVADADIYWSRLCQVIEREDLEHDPRFTSTKLIADNHTALFDILEKGFRSKTLDEWRVRLDKAGIVWGPVQNFPEVIADPQARANDLFVSYDHPDYGHIEVVSNPIKFSEGQEMISRPAPKLGQHTEEVLLEYGYTLEDIEKFKRQRIII
ncbi:CaiB/BaiF CoA transferase family protein [Chloroflexota bacterium]